MDTVDQPTPALPSALGDVLPQSVLVVDDSRSDQRLIAELLADAGIPRDAITCADTLAQARRAITEQAFECIVLDLALPDAAGLEGVAVLATALPEVPIVVVTGHPADSLVYAAMSEGADEYLCKRALDVAALQDVLLRAAQRRRGTDRAWRTKAAASSVLDSIESATAALDGAGCIIAVNQAWLDAAVVGGASIAATGVGVNYLTVCDQAAGPFAEGAAEAGAGIRGVLFGEVDRFTIDYPCPTPEADRWFSLRVTRMGELGGGAVVTHLDITDLKVAEHRLQRDDALVHSVFGESSPVFVLIDRDGMVKHASTSTSALLGLGIGGPVSEQLVDRIDAADAEASRGAFRRVLSGPGHKERLFLRARDRDGRWRDFDLTLVNLLHQPEVEAVAVTGSDVTDGRLHQIARRLESKLLQGLPTSVIVTDDRGVVVYWNDAATRMYGYDEADAVGRPVLDLDIGPTGGSVAERIGGSLAATGRWEGDYDARRADGSVVPIHTIVERISAAEIGFEGIVGASMDITDRRELEENLAFQALHDPLTELPNRRLFVDHLENALVRGSRTGLHTAVVFIDIDDFKAINDRIGHVAADEILRTVGSLVPGVLRTGDMAARLGGDEFVVCCEDLVDPSEIYQVIDRIVNVLALPFRVAGEHVQVTASMGVAVSTSGSRAEGLLRDADAAMYAAKEAGKARIELFDDHLHEQLRSRHSTTAALARAIDDGAVRAFFQPEVDLRTGRLLGFEALARWEDPVRGSISPAEFIPLAEDNGLIGSLGRHILQESCDVLAAWAREMPDQELFVSVNVSGRQLCDPAFPGIVREVLAASGAPPEALCLEVTETTLASREVAMSALHVLRSIGVQIAIDDFGTGYSSLSRLHRFPVDFLKIDQEFVAALTEGKRDDAIIGAVLGLARSLRLRTIAEGIETEAQRDRLLAMGCEMGQGWLWSPAVDRAAATEMVRVAPPWTTSTGEVSAPVATSPW